MLFKDLYYKLDMDTLIKVFDYDEPNFNDDLLYMEKAYYLEGSFNWFEIMNKNVIIIEANTYKDDLGGITPYISIWVSKGGK